MYDHYESPLSSRYASDTMLRLFSPRTRIEVWRRLWAALARAEHKLGLPITAEQVAELESLGARFQLGEDYLAKLYKFDLIFRTPGLMHFITLVRMNILFIRSGVTP